MDIVEVAKRIEQKIKLLEKGRGQLNGLASDKALTAATYEKDLAITLIKLKNGTPFILEGETIKSPPATISEKIAKGICWESKLQADQAEAAYKLGVAKLQSVEAELNGYQSIYRHLQET